MYKYHRVRLSRTKTKDEHRLIMEVTPWFLQIALQQERFPFGTGVKMEQWAFYINTVGFIRYMKASDLGNKSV